MPQPSVSGPTAVYDLCASQRAAQTAGAQDLLRVSLRAKASAADSLRPRRRSLQGYLRSRLLGLA